MITNSHIILKIEEPGNGIINPVIQSIAHPTDPDLNSEQLQAFDKLEKLYYEKFRDIALKYPEAFGKYAMVAESEKGDILFEVGDMEIFGDPLPSSIAFDTMLGKEEEYAKKTDSGQKKVKSQQCLEKFVEVTEWLYQLQVEMSYKLPNGIVIDGVKCYDSGETSMSLKISDPRLDKVVKVKNTRRKDSVMVNTVLVPEKNGLLFSIIGPFKAELDQSWSSFGNVVAKEFDIFISAKQKKFTMSRAPLCVTSGIKCSFQIEKQVNVGEWVKLVGDHELLGGWQVKDGVKMEKFKNLWTKVIYFTPRTSIEFKFVICDESKNLIKWEGNGASDNRKLEIGEEPIMIIVDWI